MKLQFGEWAHLIDHPIFWPSNVPAYAGISGGRTSGMMAALLDPRVVLTFQNTGREHPRTLDFLVRLEDALQRQIIWLEWRPPMIHGARPLDFEFAIVDYKTAARSGEPFRGCMEALKAYRATKGLGPISPWARSRICTAYLKHRVQQKWIASLGIDSYDSFVGLRADEPDRVFGLKKHETAKKGYRFPLYYAEIFERHIFQFWGMQSFDLALEPRQGNCTLCWLKDQGDLSRLSAEEESDLDWWVEMEDDFPMFGGRDFVGYAELARERPVRLAIEQSLRTGETPVSDGTLEPRRFHLVTLQEKRRLKGEQAKFSCSCEQSVALADDDDDQQELALEALP